MAAPRGRAASRRGTALRLGHCRQPRSAGRQKYRLGRRGKPPSKLPFHPSSHALPAPAPSCPARWRRTKLTRKFYAPKTYMPDGPKPPKLNESFGGWVPQVGAGAAEGAAVHAGPSAAQAPWRRLRRRHAFLLHHCRRRLPRTPPPRPPPQVIRMSEAEIIRCAGVDAAVYIKILRMGARARLGRGRLRLAGRPAGRPAVPRHPFLHRVI